MSAADTFDDGPNPLKKPELSQREVLWLLAYDRAIRAYVFATLGALAMIFLVLFMNGSDIGGVMVVILGLATLTLRWTACPPFLVLVITYFQLFPFGFPDPGSENPFQVRETHFQVVDMLLVAAVLVYLRAQYRVFGFVHQVMPFESALRRKGDVPTRRPSAHVKPDEIGWMVGTAFAVVIAGQLLWWLGNALEFVPAEDFPLRWRDQTSLRAYRGNLPPGEFRPGQNRFFVMAGGLFFGTLVVRLAFGYWRMRVMNPAEGALVLADTSWAESHRERVRVEKWRVWGVKRAERAAKEEQERLEREEKARAARERRDAERRSRRGPERDQDRRRR